MFISVFDMFKVGIGPSSSHTMGPMVAAARFLDMMRAESMPYYRVKVSLHGSLAFTGVGHASDRAAILGLAGFRPETYNHKSAEAALAQIRDTHLLTPDRLGPLHFDPEKDLGFDFGRTLPEHANGIILSATDADGNVILRETFFSIGGGFVVTKKELSAPSDTKRDLQVPYPFETAAEMLKMAARSGMSIAEMKRANEIAGSRMGETESCARIWDVMNDCIERGLNAEGVLPGGLNVTRRAKSIHDALREEREAGVNEPQTVNDWVFAYAMAVNEENAAGGQVVTAPTNGAAGVLPAVIRFWLDHVPGAVPSRVDEFLMTAAAIGGLIKSGASISGAEAGCQAEVGSASAMAAAGLCAVLDGTPEQIENAAEIALEHHLGMTCDPVMGLVQIPCIERNGLGAIKALAAASISLRGDGRHLVSLDAAISTMLQTGRDMHLKYKETSLGGLAVSVPNC